MPSQLFYSPYSMLFPIPYYSVDDMFIALLWGRGLTWRSLVPGMAVPQTGLFGRGGTHINCETSLGGDRRNTHLTPVVNLTYPAIFIIMDLTISLSPLSHETFACTFCPSQ